MMRLLQRTAFLLLLPALPLAALSQATYWGMTSAGGTADIGTIYTITEGNVFTKKYDFPRFPGSTPVGELLKASNGLYYGVTSTGGANGVGTLFSYNPTTQVHTVLINFTTATSGVGANPVGGVVQAANGTLYGLCATGGTVNMGTLYEYNISTSTATRRVNFIGTNGKTPSGRLAANAAGTILYGMTQESTTANTGGLLFQFTTSSNAFLAQFTFQGVAGNTTGRIPNGGLVRATNGKFYGVAQGGGANNLGVVFEYTTPSTCTVLQNLGGSNGSRPVAGLVEGASNVLYGVTTLDGANGVGTLFKVDVTGAAAFSKLYDFTLAGGRNAQGRLMKAANGLLYGTTRDGGTAGGGVLYSFNTSTNAYAQVGDLGAAGFDDMLGGLMEDPAGTFYGLVSAGGTGSGGALFRFVAATGVFTELFPFNFSNGASPRGRLLKASNGLFYGLCNSGGTNSLGTLFSFDPATSTFVRRYDFGGAAGSAPLGTLTEIAGKLYGLCNAGGANGGGTLFEYTIATNTMVKKQDLTVATGTLPENSLFKASNGRLYGSTSADGANGLGTLFQYVPGTNTLTVLRDLSTADGSKPLADVIQASNGLLYGTLSENGQFGHGSLYSLDPATNAFTRLYSFDGLQGGTPAGDLVQVTNGKLYGMCSEDGQFFNGCIYSWNITGATYTEEYDMQGTPPQGTLSESNLILGTDGLLYGTCTQGGTNNLGVVFRFNMTSLVFTTLQTFAGASNGSLPFDGLARETTPPAANVVLAARVFLEGPYNTGTGLMGDALRTLAGFPLTEPNTAAGFTQVGGGGETITASVLTTTGNNAIVDWVLVELRDKTNNTSVLRTRSALVQRDGDIVDLDGTSPLTIAMPPDNYFIAVRHRNHFGVMTLASVALSGSAATVDFTNGSVATFGTNAQKVSGAVRLNWAGNVLLDNVLKYTGANNDRDPILVRVGGSLPTATTAGYWKEDVNLDGVVKYTGANNDRDPILVNIGGSIPTATRAQQLP
ncbi:MAG: hypothetical protein JST66_00910 [Bacteroidetes bacterium]|nr:hypothetical protein [Bacteroidota bacterium]